MTNLIRAEILKLTRRKTYLLMVAILVSLIGMAAFVLVVFPRVAPGLAEGLDPVSRPDGYRLGTQQVIGQTWFPLILAVMTLGTELGSGFWAMSLARESRRGRHVVARLVVLTAAAVAAVYAAILIFAVVVRLAAVGDGAPSAETWLRIASGSILIEFTWVALGLGMVGLLRSIGPAIGAALALSFGDSILALSGAYANVSLTANAAALLGAVEVPGLAGFVPGVGIPPGRAAAVVVGWGLMGLALATWSLVRRDP